MYSNDELKYSKINFTAFKGLKVNWKKALKRYRDCMANPCSKQSLKGDYVKSVLTIFMSLLHYHRLVL